MGMSFSYRNCRVLLFLNDCLLMSCIKMNFLCLGKKFCPLNQITIDNTGSNRKVIFVSRVFGFQAIFEGRIKFVTTFLYFL